MAFVPFSAASLLTVNTGIGGEPRSQLSETFVTVCSHLSAKSNYRRSNHGNGGSTESEWVYTGPVLGAKMEILVNPSQKVRVVYEKERIELRFHENH
jgi:hypothetical protein